MAQKRKTSNFQKWVENKYFQLGILNVFLLFLVLLKSAGYFYPYFPLTINAIVVLGIFASIILLRLNSKFPIILALIFWGFATIFRAFNIVPWAERMAIYTYEAFAIGVIHFILDNIFKKKNV